MTSTRDVEEPGKSNKQTDIHKICQLAKKGEVQGLVIYLKDRHPQSDRGQRPSSDSVIDEKDSRGFTALQYAVLNNRPDVVRLLLFDVRIKCADYTVRGEHAQTLAHFAAKTVRGKTRHAPDICIEGVTETRLSTGSDATLHVSDIRTSVSDTPRSPELDRKTCLELLIIKDKEENYGESELIYSKDGINRQTPLHYAVVYGSISSVKTLLQADTNRKYTNLIHIQDHHGMTPLHLAATYNQIDIAKILLAEGAHVDEVDKTNSTALHYACSTGNIQIVNDILSTFGNEPQAEQDVQQLLSIRDSGKNTCLHIAAENGHHEVVERLVSRGASITVSRRDKMSPLHLAVISGNLQTVQKLLDSPGGYNVSRDQIANSTPLHLAAQHNRVEIAKLLLKTNESEHVVNASDRDQNTPLHICAQYGHADFVKLLLYKNADIHRRNTKGRIPLHEAAENNNKEAIEAILMPENSPHGHEFLNLKREERDEILKKLETLKVELTNPDNQTKGVDATENLNKALIVVKESLKKHGKTVEDRVPTLKIKNLVQMVAATKIISRPTPKTNQATSTPAQQNGFLRHQEEFQKTIVPKDNLDKLLRRIYIDNVVNTEDHNGNTPLHLAAKNGHAQVVKCLLDRYHAEYNRKNDREITALHLAAENGHKETVKAIVDKYSNAVYAEDEMCNTPLHLAAKEGEIETVNILIKNGANVNQINLDKKTPLDLAAEFGKVDICSRFVKVEAQAWMDKSSDDVSPLYLACAKGHLKVVKLLMKTAADVTYRDPVTRLNCLDIAITNDHKDIASFIIESDFWADALKNSVPVNKTSKKINTPMRRLIRNMPDVALKVLDKCSVKIEQPVKDETKLKKKSVYKYNYEFVDDLMTKDGWSLTEKKKQKYQKKHKGEKWPAYTSKARTLKKNHPLHIMVEFKREELLQHHLVNKLIRSKWWMFGAYYYLITFAIHMLFLALLTRNVIQSDPPHTYSSEDVEKIMADKCDGLSVSTVENGWIPAEKILMYILMSAGAIFEIMQFVNMKWAYFRDFENYVQWLVYIFTFLFLLDFNGCTNKTGFRQNWQWSLGAFALFFSWIDLVMYLKAFTSLGLYVIMFQLVCWTFVKVFLVFFSLILAFALGFFTLLRNQIPFRDIPNSILKTSVMFLGEIDYNDLFNEGLNSTTAIDVTNLLYPAATSVLFSFFITLASIVLMNLLVGLAVDDIKGILRKAAFKRTAMHVSLVLDVEKVLGEGIRRWIYAKRDGQKEDSPDCCTCCSCRSFCKRFLDKIKDLPVWWWNQTVDSDENAVLEVIPEISNRQRKLEETLDDRLESLEKQISKLTILVERATDRASKTK